MNLLSVPLIFDSMFYLLSLMENQIITQKGIFFIVEVCCLEVMEWTPCVHSDPVTDTESLRVPTLVPSIVTPDVSGGPRRSPPRRRFEYVNR